MSFRPPRITLPRVVMPRLAAPRLRMGRVTGPRFRLPARRRTTLKAGGVSLSAPGLGMPDDLLRQARGGVDRPAVAPVTVVEGAVPDDPVSGAVPTGGVTLEVAPEEATPPAMQQPAARAGVPWPSRRRGPATLVERRLRLEAVARDVAGQHGAVEFQTNTVAIVNHGSLVARIFKRALWLITLPPRIAAQAISWLLMPRGKGKLKRTVVVVDRRGNVVVYRV